MIFKYMSIVISRKTEYVIFGWCESTFTHNEFYVTRGVVIRRFR